MQQTSCNIQVGGTFTSSLQLQGLFVVLPSHWILQTLACRVSGITGISWRYEVCRKPSHFVELLSLVMLHVCDHLHWWSIGGSPIISLIQLPINPNKRQAVNMIAIKHCKTMYWQRFKLLNTLWQDVPGEVMSSHFICLISFRGRRKWGAWCFRITWGWTRWCWENSWLRKHSIIEIGLFLPWSASKPLSGHSKITYRSYICRPEQYRASIAPTIRRFQCMQ